jgi:hypothetical protein
MRMERSDRKRGTAQRAGFWRCDEVVSARTQWVGSSGSGSEASP